MRQLEEKYPHFRAEEPAPSPTSTIATPAEHLDLATVIKVSQAISGEIVLEKMLDTLMRTAIAHAGAERGLLILSHEAEPRIAAEAKTSGEMVVVDLRDAPVTASMLPETVLHHVLRTQQSVILDDAATEPSFAVDPYICQVQARSILCLPLINQVKLIGILYLENNLTTRAFAPARIAVLKLLASQAAISLENTRLYRDLAERESRIRRLVDANIIGIGIWDFEGHILEANDAFLQMVGYDREDLASGRLRWTELTPPEWLDRDTQQWVPEIKRTGKLQPFEKEFFRKDGSRVPVLVGSATFEGGNQGVAFVLDLTERKRTEQALRDREVEIRRLVDANIIGVFVGDYGGQILEANDAFLRMLGFDRQELISGRLLWSDLTPPEWHERVAQHLIPELKMTGRLQPFEMEYFRKDGSRIPVLVGAAAFEQDRNQAVAFMLDLTERKQTEQALRERDAKIRRLVDSNIIGMAITKANGEIIEANDAYLKMVGYDREYLVVGRLRWTDLTPPEWQHRNAQAVAEAERTGTVQPYETEFYRKDGSRVPVLVGGAAFDEELRQVVAFVLDLTERKRTEAEAQESERRFRKMQMELAHANRVATIGQLTASIAHEVNQPIAAVHTNAGAALRFLSGNTPDLEEVRKALDSIVEDTSRAGDIVHRIRALVKKEPLQSALFNINDTINKLIVLAQSEVLEKGVTVRLSLAEGLSPVRGDPVQLQQVVLNLILNAVQAMSSVDDGPRELSISSEPRGVDEVLVAVRDSGPGIGPEHLKRIFDSFYSTKPSGMGLGLSICRSIIDAHGGQLWAEAKPKGTVFQFTLPAPSNDHELPGGSPASIHFEAQPARSLSSETNANLRSFLAGGAMLESDPMVLVVDDDPSVRESVGRLLRSVGLDARLFASVRDLLKSGRPNGPICMVVDVKMPEQSGLDFQRELAAADVQIPIIFITAHGDVPMSVQAMKHGAIEFLTKPCRDEDLIVAIHVGLARDRARRENDTVLKTLRARYESLSPREREIMIHVVQGRLSKQIAGDIGSSEPTVNVHRSNLMRKMNVRSVSELARIADQLKLSPEKT